MTTLSLIVEGNSCAWGRLAEKHSPRVLDDVIRSVISFGNSHLSLSASNKLLLFAFADGLKRKLLYNSGKGGVVDASLAMAESLLKALRVSVDTPSAHVASPLASVLAHAICHMKGDAAVSVVKDSENNSPNFINGRVVIMAMTADFGAEHGILMNLFFSAAKHGICVDIISLGETSPLLQQAADITQGLFIRVDEPRRLLSQMMTFLLSDPNSRSIFQQPNIKSVDYRASCVCHHQLVATGWVCSVCLSVLCQFMPICSACGAVFKITALPKKNLKRKRKVKE